MGKIVLRKFVKPKPKGSTLIRVDQDVYERLKDISEQTSISLQKLSSILLNSAMDEVVILDEEMEEDEE